MEQVHRRGLETLLGLGLALALVLSVVAVYKSFRGEFSSDITVSATVSRAGDALEQGDIVTYRDVIVGEVTEASGKLGGSAALRLKIHRAAADVIPATVRAIAVPQSLFGTTKIVLMPGGNPGRARLSDGASVLADDSPAAAGLQTALAHAYTLLSAVRPAQLDAALSALASALQGQGENLGRLVQQADAYLRRLAPHLPELDEVITGLADVTDNLARSAPDLLSSLGNLLQTAQAVLDGRQAVAQLFAVAPTAVRNAQRLFDAENVDNTVAVLVNETAVLRAFAARPEALPQTIRGFKALADTFSTAIHGKAVTANLILTGANFAEIPAIALNQRGELFKQITDPPLYTAAQCPRYPGVRGPNCASVTTSDYSTVLLTSGRDYGGTSSSVGATPELQAVSAAASAITGLPATSRPAVADLLLGPLLRGTPTVIR